VTRVKICGITLEEDIWMAVALGVDFIGLNFVPSSPRCLTAEQGARLVQAARAAARSSGATSPELVGVFLAEQLAEAVSLAGELGLDLLQLHGMDATTRTPSGIRVVRAWRSAPGQVPDVVGNPAWAHLLDGYDPQKLGGTGRRCDWRLASVLAQRCRLFLAGGLNPWNVGDAIRQVSPFAVDVASGVERTPGVKDHFLLRAFIQAVKEADREYTGNFEGKA
jgi:phosphoribosylanthranilate isomerase